MARTLSPLLTQCLERANPAVRHVVEFAVPDQAAVLHRAEDQFLGAPLLSVTPAGSLVPSAEGGVTLNSADDTIINLYTGAGEFGIPQENGGPDYVNTAAWRIDPAFGGAVLRSVTLRIRWPSLLIAANLALSLRIFRAHQQAGTLQRIEGTSVVESGAVQVSFTDLLPEPVVVRYITLLEAGAVDGGGYADVTFDLTPYHLMIDPVMPGPPGTAATGDLPELFFTVTTNQQYAGDLVHWITDETSPQTIAGVGVVRELSWTRVENGWTNWSAVESGRALAIKVAVDAYVPTSAAVYALALGAVPSVGSVGRVVFGAGVPRGAAATMELSTDGGTTFAPVTDGDPIAVKQQTYHARLTLDASADAHRAPVIRQLGVDFRTVVDLSPESTVDHVTQDVSVPFLEASVGEGSITAVRAGRRDYRDLASDIATAGPDTKLEADVYLAPRHPLAMRADWLLLSRSRVSARVPSGTVERFTLLGGTRAIKGKIPARIESITRRHTVITSTTTQVQVSPDLQGASLAGNEYDAQHYYIRVVSSAQPTLPPGALYTISGNTGQDKLDFTGGDELPHAFGFEDEIEVHSGQYLQPALAWTNADPADVWLEILTVYRGIPSTRIGRSDIGGVGRAGLPPRVTERAPGDATTQAKLRVSVRITDAEEADALIDQLSFIMGGTTVEIGGQIVFRQIYPLYDAAGVMTVAPDPAAVVFDPRDITGLQTPTGREQRISILACDYGVPPDASTEKAAQTLVFADVDAVHAYEASEGDAPAIPDEIARWCYNTTDEGRFLAEQLVNQVVTATSTGIRLWSWTSITAHPKLTVGDGVVVITDQYTDYDPASERKIRGWCAFTLVLTGTAQGGRQFQGFLRGLRDVSALRVRGGIGTLQDINQPSLDITPTPGPSSWSLLWGGTGLIELSVDSGPDGPPGANPLTVALDGDPHAYRFRATGIGPPVTQTIHIPAAGSTTPPSFSSVGITVYNYATDEVQFDWTTLNAPVGAVFNLTVFEQTALVNPNVGDTSYHPGVTAPFVLAVTNDIDAAGPRNKTYRMTVEMVSGSSVVATSVTASQIITSNT
jgi:hypothetical protein